ncbi:MAG: sulfatase [Rikenellaceae bacterium]
MKNLNAMMMLPCLAAAVSSCAEAPQEPKPNILWVMIEDWSTDMGCYGTKGVETPVMDQLAKEGMLFTNAYTTAPVSSASRSAMMSGFYQNAVHGNQHRLQLSEKQPLPEGIKPIPHLMEEGGYMTHIMCWKTDVNYLPASREDLFVDTRDWKTRKDGERFFGAKCAPGQPWFARMTFGETHRAWDRDPVDPIATSEVELPPYYADTDFIRRDWANGLEQLQVVDRMLGEMLQRLEDEGFADNTIVIFLADNGRCHFRGKQFLYEPGVKVPMIIRWPGKIKPGTVNDTPVVAIDICQTVIDVANVTPKVPLQGLNLFGKEIEEREYIFFARDKMDDTHDAMRAVRSKSGYKLIHNLMPERPYMQYNQYKEGGYPPIAEMTYMYLTGQLNEVQSAFFAQTKPDFELYDLNNDPYEIKNLASDPAYDKIEEELLAALNDWRENVIHDTGVSDTFRALDVFPKECPMVSTDAFVHATHDKYDYNVVGWPAWFPTRSAEEWKEIRDQWVPYLYREPGTAGKRPPCVADAVVREKAKQARKKAEAAAKK